MNNRSLNLKLDTVGRLPTEDEPTDFRGIRNYDYVLKTSNLEEARNYFDFMWEGFVSFDSDHLQYFVLKGSLPKEKMPDEIKSNINTDIYVVIGDLTKLNPCSNPIGNSFFCPPYCINNN